MELRITTLSENTVSGVDLLAEWGLSILVETGEVNILLDTALGIAAGYNADTLGIDFSKVNKMVLSHGHFDHTGGLRPVLQKMRKEIEIIALPDIWADKYFHRQGKKDRFIGIPFQPLELESLGARFSLTTESTEITDSIITTGEVPMVTEFEELEPDLVVKEDTGWQQDEILDDQALIIKTEYGLVVILGCAHRGMINTIYHAQQLTGVTKIHTVLGGSHLIDTSEERIWLTIAALKELDVERLGLCHCTGSLATVMMAHEFGDKFFFNNAGTRITLP
ncbi:MBL fold metallo-hydrolase [Chloroflexota bacterium]